MQHLNIEVAGKVQGVFFRASTKTEADRLAVCGFVRNLADGSVYLEAEGEEQALKELVGWCHHGPARAQVDHVTVRAGSVQNFRGFEIRR